VGLTMLDLGKPRHTTKHKKHMPREKKLAPPAGEKKRPVWKTVLWWSALIIVGREVYVGLSSRRNRRRDVFNLASFRAQETGKKLIVIGDPDAGMVHKFIGRDYDCGDLCIDRYGCMGCPEYVTGRLEDVLPTLDANSAVIYVNSVLEKVDDINAVLHQLERVSGGDLFVVAVEPWTLAGWFYPGTKRRFHSTVPEKASFEWTPLPWQPGPATTEQFMLTSGGP